MRAIPRRLKEVSEEIDSALVQLETEANKNVNTTHRDDSLDLLKLFASCFAYVNETVNLALESYLGLEGPAREKRAWLEGLREISRDVFGTAM